MIRVLGKIDENIIYGVAKTADIIKNADGTSTIPMYKVAIIDFDGNVLKEYEKEGIYITDASVSGNVITLNRVQKRNSLELSYETIDSEAILNRRITSYNVCYTKLLRNRPKSIRKNKSRYSYYALRYHCVITSYSIHYTKLYDGSE